MIISIVMPVYNVEKYIEKSINSVINQVGSKFKYELIVVDDGSKDDSIKIAHNLLNNSKIDYKIITQKNSGVSSARNNGLTNAKGDFVLFIDSDDLLDRDFMINLSSCSIENNDIIFWSFDRIDYIGNTLEKYGDNYSNESKVYNEGTDVLFEILIEKKHLIWTGSAIYSKKFLIKNKILFNNNYINGEDQEFIFSSLISARKTSYISNTLSYYLVRKSSISTSFNIRKFDSVLALENIRRKLIKVDNINKKLIKAIEFYIVENFMYVYKSGLFFNSPKEMYKKIEDLDNLYPDLFDRIKKYMNKYKNICYKKQVEIKIAKKNLILYGIIYKVYLFIKKRGKI